MVLATAVKMMMMMMVPRSRPLPSKYKKSQQESAYRCHHGFPAFDKQRIESSVVRSPRLRCACAKKDTEKDRERTEGNDKNMKMCKLDYYRTSSILY